MTEHVRIKTEDGDEITLPAEYAELQGLKPLSKPAVDALGNPLPPKRHLDLQAQSAPESKPATGTTTKEK